MAHSWDPSVDRFARAAPLGHAGERVVPAQNLQSFMNGVLAGQERFAMDGTASGGRVLFAQSAFDGDRPGETMADVRHEYGNNQQLISVRSRIANLSGVAEVQLEAARGRLRGTLRSAVGQVVAIDEPLPPDAIADAPAIGVIQLLADRARRLATGESLVVRARDVEFEPAPRLVDVTYAVRRMADDHGRPRLSVERAGVSARWSATVSVEGDGVVSAVRQEQQIGVVDYLR